MKQTSTYSQGPIYCLDEEVKVWVVNAALIKAIPRRRTDVRDMEWSEVVVTQPSAAWLPGPPPAVVVDQDAATRVEASLFKQSDGTVAGPV